jgi:heat shock protein HslJ
MALTSEAVAEISLRDVSIADAPAPLIGQQRIENPGQVPIHFEINFPSDEIDPRRMYAVQARITDRGRLVFISDTHTPVLTRGAGDEVSMMLVAVNDSAQSDDSIEAETPGFDIEGMFRYMADAAMFRDCRDNRSYPVAMESQYIELERAYLNSGIEAGSEVYVRLKGRYLERPAMEGNSSQVKLIVDEFKKMSTDEVCSPDLHASLQNTYWKLLELNGTPARSPEGSREIHLILATAESRAHGFAGCNNFFGTYELGEDSLSFSAVGSTMMACPEGMDTEQSFLQTLGAATRAEISGQIMSLYADDRLLARFEAVYL